MSTTSVDPELAPVWLCVRKKAVPDWIKMRNNNERKGRSFRAIEPALRAWAAASVAVAVSLLIPLLGGAETAPAQPYLKKGHLGAAYREFLNAVGDRFEVPGHERLQLTGNIVLTAGGQNASSALRITLEFPGKLRADGQSVLISDSGGPWKNNGQTDQNDSDLIESLLNDSMEYFLAGHSSGVPIRQIGLRAFVKNSTIPNATAHHYDVYQSVERVKVSGQTRQTIKLYCFDSVTHLLERIAYTTQAGGTTVRIETVYSGWQSVQQQKVPMQIARYENGKAVFTFTATAVALSAAASDHLFDHP